MLKSGGLSQSKPQLKVMRVFSARLQHEISSWPQAGQMPGKMP